MQTATTIFLLMFLSFAGDGAPKQHVLGQYEDANACNQMRDSWRLGPGVAVSCVPAQRQAQPAPTADNPEKPK